MCPSACSCTCVPNSASCDPITVAQVPVGTSLRVLDSSPHIEGRTRDLGNRSFPGIHASSATLDKDGNRRLTGIPWEGDDADIVRAGGESLLGSGGAGFVGYNGIWRKQAL